MSASRSQPCADAGAHIPRSPQPLRVLDLFSGIGGFSLGLERTGGFETVAFCEIEPYARRVLAKHWPEVPRFEDVRTLTGAALRERGIAVDVICGGFPCQDISRAGVGAGLAGERSGLWREYVRLLGELRPAYVIVENSTELVRRDLGRVLGDLAALGYDAEWHCIPASALGAPHERDRIWVVAYADDLGRQEGGAERDGDDDAPRSRRERPRYLQAAALAGGRSAGLRWWLSEPTVARMVDGLPGGLDGIAALGNAVVPQIPELIGRAILASQAAAKVAA